MPYVQRDANGKVIAVSSGEARLEDGTLLTDPEPLPDGHPDLVMISVPQSVSMRQAREALIRRGYFDTVNDHITAMAGIEGVIARNEWNTSQVVERNRPLTLAMGQLLGLDAAAMDELFVFAETL